MDARLIVGVVLLLGGIVAGVAETRRYNRSHPTPKQREADRRRTAVIPAVFMTALCLVLAVIGLRGAIRGWWALAVVVGVALVPSVWISVNRWRLYRSR